MFVAEVSAASEEIGTRADESHADESQSAADRPDGQPGKSCLTRYMGGGQHKDLHDRRPRTMRVLPVDADARKPRTRVGRLIKQVHRTTLGSLMVLIGAGCFFVAFAYLRELGDSHKDTADWVLITGAAMLVAFGAGALVLAVMAFRRL